jgi:hypothetical protein
LGDIHFFLFEKGELSEETVLVFGYACDALAWGVLNVGNIFKG